jgi:hypothetical protein
VAEGRGQQIARQDAEEARLSKTTDPQVEIMADRVDGAGNAQRMDGIRSTGLFRGGSDTV